MGSLLLGCMSLGYMALPLRSPLPAALPARTGRVVQQAMDPETLAEGQRAFAVQAKEAEKRAKLAQAAHAQNTALAVQLESGMDTVSVDLALTQNADKADISDEADFMFRSVDVNGDGEISQQELQEYLGSAGYSVAQATRIFEALDVNSDESISQEELREGFARYEFSALRLAFGLAGARRHLEGDSATADPRVSDAESASRLANADELFDLIDSDCSGEVDKREFTTHLSKAGYSMVTIAQIFHILDVNLDGLISRDEMRRSFMSYEYSALRLALGIKPSGVKSPA
jgi:Ca2+-binding EF-hand superfamily protein